MDIWKTIVSSCGTGLFSGDRNLSSLLFFQGWNPSQFFLGILVKHEIFGSPSTNQDVMGTMSDMRVLIANSPVLHHQNLVKNDIQSTPFTPQKINACPLRRNHFKRKWVIFQPSVFTGYANFQGLNPIHAFWVHIVWLLEKLKDLGPNTSLRHEANTTPQ